MRLKKLRNKILHCIKLLRLSLNSNPWRTKRPLTTALGVMVLAVVLWGMSTHVSAAGTLLGSNIVMDAAIAYGIFYFGAVLLGQVLSWGLTIVASFLDFAFFLNSYINPGQLAIVQEGWTKLRDLANGIFILLLLWIALTIVFNLEGLGGKKLLVRVIMVALLINFSLVLVSTVFALGNELAKPFAKAMGAEVCNQTGTTITCPSSPTTISTLIMQNSHLQETTQVLANEGVLESFTQAQKAFSQPRQAQSEGRFRSLAQYLGAPTTAHAGPGTAAAGLGICATVMLGGALATGTGVGAVVGVPALVTGGLCAILANFAIPIATGLLFHALGVDVIIMKAIFNALVPSVFLFLTLVAMLTAAVILFLRLIAMVLLGVSAPIAFLGFAFPKFGERFWSVWLNNLFRWAAVTPIFYFLLYLALLMLQTNNINITTTPSGGVPIMGNIYRIMNLILFLIFLWAAVYVTKKTAGHFAEVALSLGRKGLGFTAGVATGFVARRALPKLGQMAERGGQAIGKVESPLLRGMLRTPAKILRRTATAGRQQVVEAQGRIRSMTSAEIQRAIGAGEFGEADLAAAMQVLQSSKDLAPIPGIAGYSERQRAGVDTIRKLGLDIIGFLRANPMLAQERDFAANAITKEMTEANTKLGKVITSREAAQRLAWKRVRDYANMDLGILEDDKAKEQMLEFAKPSNLSEIMRINPGRGREVNNYLTAEPDRMNNILNRMDEGAVRYFKTNAAGELGWQLPAKAPPIIAASPALDASITRGSYSFTPRASGKPSLWSISGALPPGLTMIDTATGEIAGTPTKPGTYTFSMDVVDGETGVVSPPRSFTIVVSP